jgi:hypothetical protein
VYQPHFISKLKSVIFHRKDNSKKKIHGRCKQALARQAALCGLMAFLEKYSFYNLFSESATRPVYLFVSLFVNLYLFLSYYFSVLKIFQGKLHQSKCESFKRRS